MRPSSLVKTKQRVHGCGGTYLQSQRWEEEAAGPEAQSHSQLHGEFKSSLGHMTPCLRTKRKNKTPERQNLATQRAKMGTCKPLVRNQPLMGTFEVMESGLRFFSLVIILTHLTSCFAFYSSYASQPPPHPRFLAPGLVIFVYFQVLV